MTIPQRIVAHLKRRKHRAAATKDIARSLGLPVATISRDCSRLAWNQALEYVVLPHAGRSVGVWRLRERREARA